MMDLMANINPALHSQAHSGEVLLIKLMLGFYEECDGFQDMNVPVGPGKANKKGIRLEDIVELLSCCACSIDDQIRMTELSGRVVQHFFDILRNEDITGISNPNMRHVPAGEKKVNLQAQQFQVASSSSDAEGMELYSGYSEVAASAEANAIASGVWERGSEKGMVREDETDTDAPLLAVDYYGRLTKRLNLTLTLSTNP
jgi:hypothetical protein